MTAQPGLNINDTALQTLNFKTFKQYQGCTKILCRHYKITIALGFVRSAMTSCMEAAKFADFLISNFGDTCRFWESDREPNNIVCRRVFPLLLCKPMAKFIAI